MTPLDKKILALVLCLSALAGYVDALGFMSIGGFFVSFMSGNSTRLGVALSDEGIGAAAVPAALLALFVAGVVAGSLIGHAAKTRRLTAILGFVTALLVIAALLHGTAGPLPAVIVMAAAMGATNTLFEKDGEVSIAITYMTGTLVRMGQHLAAALRGQRSSLWLRYLMLWAGFAGGASLGAAAYMLAGLAVIWPAAGLCAALTGAALRIEGRQKTG